MSVIKGVVRAIHESISFRRMTMEIQEDQRIIFLCHHSDKRDLFILLRSMKIPIDISTNNRSPEVTEDNSVNIDHRNDPEHYLIPKSMSLCRADKSKKPVHHPTALCFSWMQSPNRHACGLIFILVGIRDVNNRYRQPSSGEMVIVDIDYLWIILLYTFYSMHQI